MTTAHTPTPWACTDFAGPFDHQLITGEHGSIARVHAPNANEGKANAAFIVQAVNAHEALVAALKAILSPFEHGDKIELHNTDDQYHTAREALKLAGVA